MCTCVRTCISSEYINIYIADILTTLIWAPMILSQTEIGTPKSRIAVGLVVVVVFLHSLAYRVSGAICVGRESYEAIACNPSRPFFHYFFFIDGFLNPIFFFAHV